MKTTEKTIPLFFSVDDKYVPFLAVALKSIIDNATDGYDYQIIILHEGISQQNQKDIAAIGTEQFPIRFVSMKGRLEHVITGEQAKLRGDYFTYTIFFRLFIADMFPEYDKAIYLDADIVVPRDISQLFNIELGNNLVAGIPDVFIGSNPETVEYSEDAVGVPVTDYINSGILVMNLKELRATKLGHEFVTLYNKYHFQTIAPDQDYLNAMGHDRILRLGVEWNTQAAAVKEKDVSPKLIHYNLFAKPWQYKHTAFESYFWPYAKETPYYDQLIAMRDNYSVEQQDYDQSNLSGLLVTAPKVAQAAMNFKKAALGGEKIRL
ncbi:hypothetical protein BSQ39_11520 [Loigolactobacillus backii]|uniref:glycosyltransferase family 8 protein n=1 Tax=Loigolactobacillus backii TaxID=375175 RepID=UPI0007F0EDF2|nr:glycosyltransferase family 8 protein [Loigolactobacillus backii]ANK58885.1 hypothetical protein AYR52_00555 [Loigolactobacillus backii]ANK63874.1 hypothetical protein AYR54_00545 [Loigolactobacillus backii]ANK66322.1 hypothetical protein AYR55_00550 [Loigolactobacillus backii]OLF68383.1 hypothetical protein ACX53_11790 [Loigolactobacillus backii]PIO84143.1 hypothetical protein BSQ39_11520 [Loigolactobacillus backii]